MLSTVTLGDLGDLRTGFNAAVSGAAAGSRRRGSSRGFFTALRLQPALVAATGHGPRCAEPLALWRPGTWLAALDPGPNRRRGALGSSLLRDAVARGGTWVGFRLGQPLRVTDNRGQ